MVLGGERVQVHLAEARADRRRLGRDAGRGLDIAGGLVLEHVRQQEVAPFHAVTVLALDEPAGAPEPPGRTAELAAQDEVDRDPERTARRAQARAAVEVRLIRPLHGARVVRVAAQHVGRCRQRLEIVGIQRLHLMGTRQRLVGVQPGPARIGRTAALEVVDRTRHAHMLVD